MSVNVELTELSALPGRPRRVSPPGGFSVKTDNTGVVLSPHKQLDQTPCLDSKCLRSNHTIARMLELHFDDMK